MVRALLQKGNDLNSFINKASIFWHKLVYSSQGSNSTGLNHTILIKKKENFLVELTNNPVKTFSRIFRIY